MSQIYSINLFLQDKIRVLGDFFRIPSVGLPNVGSTISSENLSVSAASSKKSKGRPGVRQPNRDVIGGT
ncbi:MAG: hypothetical protein WBM86_27250 [Waterburya sp.]